MKTLTTKLLFMLFIIGMIGISSCTEQEVITAKDPDAQAELRTSTPCGDAPNINNSVTILSTRTGPNGECCVTIQVNIRIEPGWTLSSAQYFVDENGNSYYLSPCNRATLTLQQYNACLNMQVNTQAQTEMIPNTQVYELCFEHQIGTKYLNIGITGSNGQFLYCSYFANPCN